MRYLTTECTIFFIGLVTCAVADGIAGLAYERDLMEEKCKRNGEESTFQDVENASKKFVDCIQPATSDGKNALNYDGRIMMHSQSETDVQNVINKYCQKSPLFEDCWSNLLDAMTPCLEEKERKNTNMWKAVLKSILIYICYEDSTRLKQLLAPKDVDCALPEGNLPAILSCFGDPYKNVNVSDIDLTTGLLQLFKSDKFKVDSCNDVTTLQACVVGKFGSCKNPTPVNIVRTIAKKVIGALECSTLKTSSIRPGSVVPTSGTDKSAISFLSMVLFMVMSLRFK